MAWTLGRRLEDAIVRGAHLCARPPQFRLMKRKQVSKVKGTGPYSPRTLVVVNYEDFDEQIPNP